MQKKICVLGLGYIGLPTAAIFAMHGHQVIGVDINEKIVNTVNEGRSTFDEPYLDLIVQAIVSTGKLRAAAIPEKADAYIICVPTPITEYNEADLSYAVMAANSIVEYLEDTNIVILESTSPVGTTKDVIKPIMERSGLKIGSQIFLGYSPERVIPGKIIFELMFNNRIIGGINEESAQEIKKLYESFVKGNIYTTTSETAELCKLAENTFRDVNIALANELVKISSNINVNPWEVIELSNKHPRVDILQPGPGVGGHCISVDPWFLIEKDPENAKIINQARRINDSMPEYVFNQIENILADIEGKKKVTILGITYKADINDIRHSPIIELVKILDKNDYDIAVVDPNVEIFKYLSHLSDAVKNSNLLVLGVGHSEFKTMDIENIAGLMKTRRVFDTRNFFDRERFIKQGFKYVLLGE